MTGSGLPGAGINFPVLFCPKQGLRPCTLLHGEGPVIAASFEDDLADPVWSDSKHLKSVRMRTLLTDVKDLAEVWPPRPWGLRSFPRHLAFKIHQWACNLSKLMATYIS